MTMIDSDKDMPEIVNTEAKQIKWAKKLISQHFGTAPKRRTYAPPFQGSFSRTVFVQLADEREVVIQLRPELLDLEPFVTAKKVLGSLVPDIQLLEDEELRSAGVWAYCLERIPGEVWFRGEFGKGEEARISVNKSLGRIFSKGFIADNSGEAIETVIRPRLEAILASDFEDTFPYKKQLQSFATRLDEFVQLPLWIAHYDVNEVNVLVDANCEVTGLVDWEFSTPLPFGFGFNRLHTCTGKTYDGKFYFSSTLELAERGFWDELFKGMPHNVRSKLEKQIDLVQDAVILGTMMDVLSRDRGMTPTWQSLAALPKWLTYRIPSVRGSEGPYKEV